MLKSIGLAVLCLTAVGCTSYDVRPLKYSPEMKSVTVVRNPKVRVSDFLNVMEDEFGARGIPVVMAPADHVAQDGEYVVTYDARQSWDFTTYLADANVRIRKDNLLLGQGHYHHRGGSLSLSPWKWQGTKKKMSPFTSSCCASGTSRLTGYAPSMQSSVRGSDPSA